MQLSDPAFGDFGHTIGTWLYHAQAVEVGSFGDQTVRRAHESALRGSCHGLLGRGFVVLPLLLLFLFRQLLLLVLFLVFLAALVSHLYSFSTGCGLKFGSLRG
jgi:hypothetical protein